MSEKDMWAVVARAQNDSDFATQLFTNFDKALADNGFSLTPDEIEEAKKAMRRGPAPSAQPPIAIPKLQDFEKEMQFKSEKERERLSAQVARMIDLGNYTVEILKNTLNNAAMTYRRVTFMNTVMFWMGVSLFVFAAVYGVITQKLAYTVAFGGLGAGAFVALFFLGSIEKTQSALANLIQAEIAFMNYFEQITFLENFAMLPKPGQGLADHDYILRASELLQERSRQTMHLLQLYVEDTNHKPVIDPVTPSNTKTNLQENKNVVANDAVKPPRKKAPIPKVDSTAPPPKPTAVQAEIPIVPDSAAAVR
jgi:hypothetical protein